MWSNPRRLFSFHASSNAGLYQNTMTSHNDPRMWCHELKVCFLLKHQTSTRITPRTCAFITLRDNRHVWTDRNSLTGIDRQWVKLKFSKVFHHKLHLKSIQNVWIVVINDNNNFAQSLFQSLCEFVSDCFGPRYFSSGAVLLQKNISVQNNHLRFHTMTLKKIVHSYYCLNNPPLCTNTEQSASTVSIWNISDALRHTDILDPTCETPMRNLHYDIHLQCELIHISVHIKWPS